MKLLYIPIPSEEEAIKLAKALLADGLIACANVLPAGVSVYKWEGEVQSQREFILIAKTTAEMAQNSMLRARELHPYELPCILILPVDGALPEFKDWVFSEVCAKP